MIISTLTVPTLSEKGQDRVQSHVALLLEEQRAEEPQECLCSPSL